MSLKPKARFDELLQKEMTRKEFVIAIGMALLAVTGLPSLLSIVTKTQSAAEPNDGFGSGIYR